MPELRPARHDDHALYLRLFPELGVDDPPADAARWASEMVDDCHVLLDDDGRAAGYALTRILDDCGYVRHVVVDRVSRGRGLGRFVMEALAGVFRAAGCRAWCLNVKPDNEPAIRLYRAVGMRQQHRSVSLRMRWSSLDELDPPTEAVQCCPVGAAEMRGIDERFALPRGLLASLDERERVVIQSAWREGELVGVASFDPAFPGCFPFRAQDLDVAAALLAAVRPHADPAVPHLQIVLEDAPMIHVALERAGAWRALEFLHFRGAL